MDPGLTPTREAAAPGRIRPGAPPRERAALLSVGSNAALIAAKLAVGLITGSVAVLTEALHSSIDLIASGVAYVSIRKADVPADEDHRYGHEKIENMGAAGEGVLILVGSAIIAYEAIQHLVQGSTVHQVGLGIAVVAGSMIVNLVVSGTLDRRARATESPALAGDAAHLRTDALTSAGVLVALALVGLTSESWIDPAVALVVAVVIVGTGVRILSRSSRVLVDEGLPHEELEVIRTEVMGFGPRGVAGFHKLRTRRAGPRRYVDLHVQFRSGTTLEVAHQTAHELQDAITARLRRADVLIHLEPEDRVQPGTEVPDPAALEEVDPG